MAKLLIQESAGVREFEIVDQETHIGRELDNALRVADPSISRHHCVLRRVSAGYEIADLQSSNGVLVNGNSVQSALVKDGDRISVYPVFETLDIGPVTRLRPVPLREPRFVLDVHLQKLARRLRLLGFDVDFSPCRDDDQLAEIAAAGERILLSRDRQLMMRRKVARGLYVRNTDPELQVEEILDRLDLRSLCRPFTRCIECNGAIAAFDPGAPGSAEDAAGIPEGVRSWCSEYFRCRDCGRIYWKGSHYEKLRKRVEKILPGAGFD